MPIVSICALVGALAFRRSASAYNKQRDVDYLGLSTPPRILENSVCSRRAIAYLTTTKSPFQRIQSFLPG